MNLSEALDAALPEIPKTRLSRTRPPCLDPELVVREDVLDGEPIIGILQRGKGNFFRFQPMQWQLAQYFDGVRSYEEIAEIFTGEAGVALSAKDVEAFAVGLDEADFWYKSPQEKNIAYSARLKAQRSRKANRKSKINLAHISFSAWDPDRYLTWLNDLVGRYVYSSWSVLFVLALFCFEGTVFVAKWKVLGPDIPLYFNFQHKSFLDFAEFWFLLFGLGFIHETAHGLTCKHYGGEVHSMGLMFLYLTPAFFVDVTESWVSGTKIQRLATIIAGIWIEMTICGFAMIVWTNTQPGEFLHDFTYKIILITGLAVVVMNLNPLLKLDGYYFLTEVIGVPDLKERSTAFVSAWFQRVFLRLPVEVPSIPRKRAPFFILYAVISGAYSYLLLFAAIRFSYNLTSKLFAEFALIPAGYFAFVMFRSRINSLRGVMREFRARHFEGQFRWKPLTVTIALMSLVLLFAPIFAEREKAYFVVEAENAETLHATVSGTVDAVYVREGQRVRAGEPLLKMTSVMAVSMASGARSEANAAHYSAFEAELEGRSVGAAAAGEEAARRSGDLAREASNSLVVASPVDGVVLTEDPGALPGRVVGAGQPLLSLAGASSGVESGADGSKQNSNVVARVLIPAGELSHIPARAEVALAVPGEFKRLRLRLGEVQGDAVALPAGLVARQDYKGIELPTFYAARLPLPASAPALPVGMGGEAIVFGTRKSLAERGWAVAMNLVRAHVW
jgi:putative peptide zinc metalloprotease protein